MPKLDELIHHVGKMSDEELQTFIRQNRVDRKISRKVERTTTKKSRVKATDKLRELLKSLPPEERVALLGGK